MPPTLKLPTLRAGAVQLCHAAADEACRSALSEEFGEILTADELQRAQRFQFAANRQEYLVGRAIVRLVLAGHLGCEPSELVLGTGPRGKPELASPAEQRVQFNVSHSAGMVVAAFSLDGELGVDVEDAQRSISSDVIRQAFTGDEIDQWAGLPLGQRIEAAAARWTLKEAYLKARGDGLHLPLLGFSFAAGKCSAAIIQFSTAIDDKASRWRFYQTQLPPRHVVSLAVRHLQSSGGRPNLASGGRQPPEIVVELQDFVGLLNNQVAYVRPLQHFDTVGR